MTTVKDMLVAALRDIGADGVAGTYDTMTLDEIAAMDIDGRPAFLDASGKLVPLPEGWKIDTPEFTSRAHLCTRRGDLQASVAAAYLDGPRWQMSATGLPGLVRWYRTAPEAWAAAEAWLKEQGR